MLLKLKRVRWQALVLLVLLFSITLGIIIGSTAANTVPSSYASESIHARTIEQLTPPECTGMGLNNLIVISAANQETVGTDLNDLILGTSGKDYIEAGKGNDCVVGGGGDDQACRVYIFGMCIGKKPGLLGNQGDDVILGGDGDDYINGGAKTDICYGGAGSNQFKQCESTP